jgi:predicted permease
MNLLHRLRALFRKEELDRELSEEMAFHLEKQIEQNVAAGMSAEEARFAALRKFGGVEQTKEDCRDAWGLRFIDTLIQDIRFGLRQLRRNPGFTAVAVLTLALGIGANTAIFSVVNAVLLRPLAYQDAERLVVILHYGTSPVAPANFVDWRHQNHVFERMGAAEYWTPNLAGIEKPEQISGLHVTSDILPLLGVQPLMGRMFLPEEDQRGREHEIVLSFRLWQQRFGGDPHILGQTMTLDGEKYTVIGVMPRDFRFAPFWATKAVLWAPLPLADRIADRNGNSLRVFARLKPDVTLEQARAEMATITARLDQQYPGTNREYVVLPLKEKVVGDIRPALLVLLGAVGFVLLIACANVAHMMLARAAARQKEVAVRTALGAGRSRVIRQFLTESLLLTSMGAGVGLLLAVLAIRALIALSPEGIPRVESISLDGHVLLFMLAVSVLTGLAFGLTPAWQATAFNLSGSLKDGGRGSTEGIRRNRLRSLLIASEFALALILLVGAGLMIRSFAALEAVDPGFDPHNVLSFVVNVTGSGVASGASRVAFFQELLERTRSLEGVRSASGINHLPLAGDLWTRDYLIEGKAVPLPGEVPEAVYRVAMPGYFRTMNMTLLRGRDIAESDRMSAPAVVVINQEMARLCWPGADPLGKRIALADTLQNAHWMTVVGVVKNVQEHDWAAPLLSEVYLPVLQTPEYFADAHSQFPYLYLTVVVRTSGDPAALMPAIRNEVRALDGTVTISQVQTMEQAVADATAQPLFYLLLLGTFAAVALVLAAVGIYGVVSYSVSRRTHEIGIRMALGAKRSDVLKLVTGQGMILALVGTAVGAVGALPLARLISSLLYGVHPTDPVTFGVVAGVLTAVALLACYIPARRAAKVDPIVALRNE